MGVDPQLFSLSTEAGKSEVVIPTPEQLVAWNVVNNGEEKPVWGIQAYPNGVYLEGEDKTIWGDNKLAFICGKGGAVTLVSVFPARGREQIIATERSGGLLLDGKVVRVSPTRVTAPGSVNGVTMVTYTLDRSLVQKVLAAHTIGTSLQTRYDAGMFDGIADFVFTDGSKKLAGFISTCH